MVTTREAAQRFARTWEACWGRGEADPLADLYAPDCVHRSAPFRPVHRGRAGVLEYARWAFGQERAVEVRFGPPAVDGDRAVVEFWATQVEADGGKPVTIAGCVWVRFNPDGLAAETRDYWHVTDGHRRPESALFLAG
ncbi:MAG TPA: nuclear transport factor 2 family protein [Mycobacteriales bacterium]|nr:nuclear transport factor 2 family protein [Mycobacteriales bacterium]